MLPAPPTPATPSGGVAVDPQQLRAWAAQLRAKAQDYHGGYAAQCDDLLYTDYDWSDGESTKVAAEMYQNWKTRNDEFLDRLTAVADKLAQAADRYTSADAGHAAALAADFGTKG